MRPGVRLGLQALSFGVLAVPVAVVVTFVLTPFWGWIEATYGIESLGHSGPSDWCFLGIYGLIILVGAVLVLRRWRAPHQE